ncbi:MAG TPA: Rieske (2Fe-2S) protein [Trebonia sp.]|nr:Rieske (2Fe-2S) protein [Trebonia sp.]
MTEQQAPSASRRAVLAAAAGGACAAALAGCATYNANNGGVNGPPPAPPSSTGAGGGTGGTGSSSGAADVLASTSDIPVGGGEVLSAKQIVITQPTAGTFKAFTAVCTHQGCIVATVAGGTIDCPCHGSKFSAANGSVVNGPATSPLASIAITVQGTSIIKS